MSFHQIIFTSCKRGIEGVGGGQQVFSYDESFNERNREDVSVMFKSPGESEKKSQNDEDRKKYLPQSFTFRNLNNGKCALGIPYHPSGDLFKQR